MLRVTSSLLFTIAIAPGGCEALLTERMPQTTQNPTPYRFHEHGPITRESAQFIYQRSQGMNPDGYFYNPPSSKDLWGVTLEDGNHRFPVAWEDPQGAQTAIIYRVHQGYVIGQDFDLGR